MKRYCKIIKIILSGFVTGLCNGLFGSGGGTIVVPAMIHFLEVEEHDAHATALVVILPLAVISSLVYYRNGFFQWDIMWKVAIGGIVGGVVGALLLHRISSNWLRKIFAVFMMGAAIRMIL